MIIKKWGDKIEERRNHGKTPECMCNNKIMFQNILIRLLWEKKVHIEKEKELKWNKSE